MADFGLTTAAKLNFCAVRETSFISANHLDPKHFMKGVG